MKGGTVYSKLIKLNIIYNKPEPFKLKQQLLEDKAENTSNIRSILNYQVLKDFIFNEHYATTTTTTLKCYFKLLCFK